MTGARSRVRHRGHRARRAVLAPLALALTAALGLLLGTGGSLALFSDQSTVTTGAFDAGAVATPVVPTTAQKTAATVTLSWTATRVGPTDGLASSYEVLRWTAATGGTSTTACSRIGTPTARAATTCADTTVAAGTPYWYSVRARVGDNWVKEGARVRYDADTTGPTLGLTQPKTTNVTGSNLRTQVSACTPAGIACGTATDPAGVTLVEYSLRRVATLLNLGLVTQCWNGTTWVTTQAATCPVTQVATGTTSWAVPGSPATAYPDLQAATFTLSLRATDGFGNTAGGTVDYATTAL